MTKIKYLVLLSFAIVLFQSCTKDASAPPQPSFSVDITTGQAESTVFTFTVNQVSADAISLFPYGTEVDPVFGSVHGGILIPASSFVDGKATVTVTYVNPGTFNAVVIANNHTTNGSSIKNVTSPSKTISIFSSWCAISYFTLSNSKAATIDEDAKTISVTVPYGAKANVVNDLTKLAANFVISPFAKLTVGGTAQVAATTTNNFTTPVQFVVTAANGQTATYTVTATPTAAETSSALKSASGVKKSGKAIPASVDDVNKTVVLYDTLNTTGASFDSTQLSFATIGSFASTKYDSAGTVLKKGNSVFAFSSGVSNKKIVVHAQDSTTSTYTVYAVAAPKLALEFDDLNPMVTATTTNFAINADVLTGTTTAAIATWTTISPSSGTTVTAVTANGNAFSDGDSVDYSNGATFVLTVNDTNLGITYKVTYTATATVVQ